MCNKCSDKIPVILDTDLGSDIDDMWAIAMMLNSPEFDIKLIVTANGNTLYRAKIIAKFLEKCGRTEIPIGIGIQLSDQIEAQGKWVESYELESFPGKIHSDGVGAMIDAISNSPVPATLVSIGPVTNIAAALERVPEIAHNAKFVGMQGSVHKGYMGSSDIVAEYNILCDVKACQKVFTAPWDMLISPVDTCGLVQLKGDKYRKMKACKSKIITSLMENYKIWDKDYEGETYSKGYDTESTILYDTVAVYLAYCEDLLWIEEIGIRVNDDGFTVIDDTAKKIRCATGWKDLEAFEDLLIDRLMWSC